MDFPVTRLGNVEPDAEIKERPEAGDYLALVDGAGWSNLKKVPLEALTAAVTGGEKQSFSEEVSYGVGEYCYKDGELYRCTEATAAGSWDAAKWVKTSLLNELKTLRLECGKLTSAVNRLMAQLDINP